ncbi:MAG: hypothetical protein K2X81_17490, partial [Candidatus Obscuribacterales bacterium]|nr:hypothetical protein [Candidatus Obscuribacterales bacterium]
ERSVRSTALQRPGRVRRVAVLGAISMAEGGLLLEALATDARQRDLPLRFFIAGSSDPALTGRLEQARVTETGCYSTDDPTLDRLARAAHQIAETGHHWEDEEILDLASQISANLVLLPAIWPDTSSYALTLALRTGLPVTAFDHGAPSERLRTHPNGHLLPCALAIDPSAINDYLLRIDVSASERLAESIQAVRYADMIRNY